MYRFHHGWTDVRSIVGREFLVIRGRNGITGALVEDHVERGEGDEGGDIPPRTEVGLHPGHSLVRIVFLALSLQSETHCFSGEVDILRTSAGAVLRLAHVD